MTRPGDDALDNASIPSEASARTCQVPACDTVLSRYNDGTWCARHQDAQRMRWPVPAAADR
jgi:hypothetical protein